MSKFYDISNDLDTIVYRMECFTNALETMASADEDDLTSGTMWFLHDTVKQYADQINIVSGKAMMAHLDLQETGKKNANGKKK